MVTERIASRVPVFLSSRRRFGVFFLTWALAAVAAGQWLGWSRSFVAGFDLAALSFIVMTLVLMAGATPERMRAGAAVADASHAVLLVVAGFVIAAIMAALTFELLGDDRDRFAIAVIIATLPIGWVFSNLVYAVHYAHIYYRPDNDGSDSAGINFPGTDEPDYWDFCYFAMTLGMAFTTSDASITSPKVRRVALGHCLVAFAFNLGVVALTVNVLAGVRPSA